MSSSYFGAGASRPIIRGLAGARVQMLEDGIDTMDAATVSDDHAVTVEPLAADQIEIFRGPTTLLYGSGAVGGVVNTVTTRIPTRAPDDGFEGAFEVRGDTRGRCAQRAPCASTAAERDSPGTSTPGAATATTTRFPGFAHADADVGDADPDDAFGVLANSAAESECGRVRCVVARR